MTQGVSCFVCGKQKAPGQIHRGQSKLIKTESFLICNTCDAEKKEPRAYIIIVARTRGFEKVKDYINNRRYVGDEITAKEITPK